MGNQAVGDTGWIQTRGPGIAERHETRPVRRRWGGGCRERPGWCARNGGRPLPPADAIAVAPATFKTINKWAAGISDTLALGILCEAYGMGIPIAAFPNLNAAQAAHPAYARSLDVLREMGVLIGSYEPHKPKAGGGADRYRWEEALELLAPELP